MTSRIDRWDLGVAAILMAASFCVYGFIGYTLSTKGAFAGYDHVFNADPNRAIEDLAGGGCAFEVATTRHPLLVLFFSPWGSLLNHMTGSKVVSALVLNSLFGGLLVGLFYVLLQGLGLGQILASAFTVMLAFSASSLVFGSVPDTFIFAAFALLLLFAVHALIDDRKFLIAFVPASVFAVGITSWNIVACLVIAGVRYGKHRDDRNDTPGRRLARALVGGSVVVLIFAALLLVQKLIYPSTFSPTGDAALEKVLQSNASFPLSHGSLGVLEKTVPFFYRDNVIAPGLGAEFEGTDPVPFVWPTNKPLDRFESEGRIGEYNIRLLSRLLYFAILATAACLLVRNSAYKDGVFVALSAYYAVTVLFHLFYGTWQVYVFSAHYTFPWVAMLALSLKPVGDLTATSRRLIHAALFCFLMLMILNNALFAYELIHIFR